MAEKDVKKSWVMVKRAPVLTLWAAVVAEVLGFEHDKALTLGRAVAGFNAYLKGVSVGLFRPTPTEVKEQRRKMRKEETVTIDLLHRAVQGRYTDEGLRPLSGDSPIRPESVQKYLKGKFGNPWRTFRKLSYSCAVREGERLVQVLDPSTLLAIRVRH
jgi:hypothetical protein